MTTKQTADLLKLQQIMDAPGRPAGPKLKDFYAALLTMNRYGETWADHDLYERLTREAYRLTYEHEYRMAFSTKGRLQRMRDIIETAGLEPRK